MWGYVDRLARLGDGMRGLRGWRRIACAMALGAFSAAAFAPLDLFPALLLGFAGLALLLDGALEAPHRLRAAAATGWAFAFGQFFVGLHWIAYPFLVDPNNHLWQLPVALSLLPAGLGLFGVLAVLPAALVRQSGTARLLLLAVGYAGAEWLRGHVLTGFPWNLPAYGWGASLAVMQAASLMGAYGLSFLTILLGVSLAALTRRRLLLPGAMFLLFVGLWGFGALQLAGPSALVPGVTLRLTAQGATLMTGAIRVDGTPQHFNWYNSLYAFGPGGAPLAVYDKVHLVPFGEYLPYPGLMNALGISQLTGMGPGATPGSGRHRYALPGAPNVTPLICYEAIFPGAVTAPEGRPGWFVNVTDDSWFGPWAGPAQHLLSARMRTIEEGVPMARAANTGISAVIDGRGRILGKLGLSQMGVLDMPLPGALAPTPYAQFGDWVFVVLLIFTTAAGFLAARKAA